MTRTDIRSKTVPGFRILSIKPSSYTFSAR